MRFRHRVVACVVFGSVIVVGLGQEQERFSGEQALETIQELCRPAYAGRKTGLEGARKAAAWIGSQFKMWGLEPGGENGTYFQMFPMLVTEQKKPARMNLENGLFGSVVYQEGNDFTVYFNSGSGRVTAGVVFVGYGISAAEKGWDDYAGVDARNKIVLIYQDRPQDGGDWTEEASREYKMRVAAEKGVVGVLMFSRRDWPVRGGTIHEESYQPNLPAFNVSQKVARDLFQGTYRNLDHTIRDLIAGPRSFDTAKRVSLEVAFERIDPGLGENVLGFLPGTDPELKKEVIVVGGHFDHNGVSPDGHLYVGADDNASGTAVVMELARLFAGHPEELKRSVLFAAFGAEEQGLVGSEYFAEHPTVAGGKICAMLNFDMEGCGDGGAGMGGRNLFPCAVEAFVDGLPDSVAAKLRIHRAWGMGGSDHAHFVEQGIPAFGFYSTGDHPFYHRVEDTPRTINPLSLQFVGDRASGLLQTLADWPTSLLYDGLRTGRCFVVVGHQVDFDLGRHRRATLEKDLDVFVRAQARQGVRVVTVSLVDSVASGMGPLDFYRTADGFSEWMAQNKDRLMRYVGGGGLNESAGSGRVAVALGMVGTSWLGGEVGLFRNLVRLGLDVLCMADAADPVFEDNRLSPWGEAVFQVCADEGVLVDWTVEDTLLTADALTGFRGKVVLRMKVDRALTLDGQVLALLKDKRCLLAAQCCPRCRAQDLASLMDRLGKENLHFSVVSDRCASCEAGTSGASDAWVYGLVQELYEERRKEKGKREAYRDMTAVLGGSLRAFLE